MFVDIDSPLLSSVGLNPIESISVSMNSLAFYFLQQIKNLILINSITTLKDG